MLVILNNCLKFLAKKNGIVMNNHAKAIHYILRIKSSLPMHKKNCPYLKKIPLKIMFIIRMIDSGTLNICRLLLRLTLKV